jgi:NitT/TauT family transport system substrate-binding protein
MKYAIGNRAVRAVVAVGCAATVALAVAAGPSAAATNGSTRTPTISKARCAQNRAAGTVTYVSPFGYGPIPGILEIFVAQKLGYFSSECLDVAIVANSYTSNQLVSAGTATFTSEGSAADTLVTIAGGANMVSLATLANTSSYVLLTRPAIRNLKQLEGKKLGIHAPMPVMLTEMLSKAHVDLAKVTTINDQTYDPMLLARGTYDALQAYQENEPLTLRAANVAIHEWTPAQFGIAGTFNTMVANGTFVKTHPTAATDFLRAELHAINYCEGHVARCVAIERNAATGSGASFDVGHATAEWNLSVSLMKHHSLVGRGIGVQTTAEWQPEATALRTFKVLASVPSLKKAENTAIVASLYQGTHLIWPAP